MTSTDYNDSAAATLRWVKVRGMQVFWPACVYKSYSAAVAHTHDVWSLRNEKPVLDAEDRIVYFFGVGPRACHVVATGSSPNLQLCVAHEDDLSFETWTTADEFPVLCAKHQLPDETVKRAQNNPCFMRACDEAATYAHDVHTDAQAAELFVTLLTMAKTAHKTGKAVVLRKLISSPPKANVKTTKKSKDATPERKPTDIVKLLMDPGMTAIVTKCWQKMIETGWETMTQGDGQVLYKMPGTSFFDFVPNVNLFDSLEKACERFLGDWVNITTDESDPELTESLWLVAVVNGWESMETSSETLYKKIDLSFDQWVPNVTIFRSKFQAVANYLNDCGLTSFTDNNTLKKQLSESDAAESDVEMVEPEFENEEKLIQSIDDSEEYAEENKDVEANSCVGKDVRFMNAAGELSVAKTITEAPTKTLEKQAKLVQNESKLSRPKQVIPPFKMAFGKLESELKRRGWYWKSGGLQWNYYQPYCKTKDNKALQPNVDYFCGREELEEYLNRSGEYEHIFAKLEEDHIRQFITDSENESDQGDDCDSSCLNSLVQMQTSTPMPIVKSKVTRTFSRGYPNRSKNTSRFRRARSKSSVRAPCGLSSQTTLSEVKFGEIWRILSEDGWHYRYGILECDYFKPHCATIKDGSPGVDYFQTKDQLIEYLKSSGLWNKTAARVRAEAAMDTSDGSLSDSDAESTTFTRKRKRHQSTPVSQHDDKKNNLHCTPIEKEIVTNDLCCNGQDTQTTSPAFMEVNGKESNGSGRKPLRNLANSFTPSPNTELKKKSFQRSSVNVDSTDIVKEATHMDLIRCAIQKLTAAYIPTNFCHREEEFDDIRNFFRDCFRGDKNSSLYISGAPGCGKTALFKATQPEIEEIFRECCPQQAQKPVHCHVNAMTLAGSCALFCKLAKDLTNESFSNGNEAFEAIERATTRELKSSKTMILILDEIDILLKNNQIEDDLCRLFKLAHKATNSFILIGIANQVDFTERHMPMLQQQMPDCSPRVIIFKPYNHQTIEQILIDRLGGETAASKLVSPHGITFLARKIASTSGDIRLAVDTCRRVLQHKLDQTEKENAENPLDDTGLGRPLPLTDMLRIIKYALESKSALIIRSLPRNLQMILFAATRLLLVAANRATEDESETAPLLCVDELYSCYCEVSKDAGVFKPLSMRDFRNALDTLGEEGLIAGPELRKHLVKVLCSTSELLQSFRKDAFLSRLV
ncbi:cell division control protein 6 homolog [Plasmopara halstedii]|uniref:Cell division control protein 6 homolog n=1 Tax=Plasmopara halstedii TaxID=4781 RepID=A0A0P1B304_PLAHL|nr:cell division control protein 6 homolog [Plasmopara halstedii]CEG49158.1 cell division control protein 6 homolog [Plasmopara halstedii]|eukprot:XP_024585527.1 cell division control protein 6 homolog [Plasmopara halstedii]